MQDIYIYKTLIRHSIYFGIASRKPIRQHASIYLIIGRIWIQSIYLRNWAPRPYWLLTAEKQQAIAFRWSQRYLQTYVTSRKHETAINSRPQSMDPRWSVARSYPASIYKDCSFCSRPPRRDPRWSVMWRYPSPPKYKGCSRIQRSVPMDGSTMIRRLRPLYPPNTKTAPATAQPFMMH